MTWMVVRLELGRTQQYPDGSMAHAYILHVPLNNDGHIDDDAFKLQRERARVTRLWPGDPDMHGKIIRKRGGGWALSYIPGEEDDEALPHLEAHHLRIGDYIAISHFDESSGKREQLPFKIISSHPETAGAA